MAYEAIITSLKNVRAHSNADRVQLATVAGVQVVVGLDNTKGQLGVFFADDGCLSKEMAKNNNLYSKPEMNADPEKSGYFGKNRRVRAQNFRGEKSYGFWIELDSLAWTGVDLNELEEGFTFTVLNGQEVCKKYINPATLRMAQQNKQKQQTDRINKIRKRFSQLKEHFDTKQLRYEIGRIPSNSVLYITSKLHGCVDRNTLIDTLEYGEVRIGKIVEDELMVHVKSYNTRTREIEYAPIEDFYFYPDDDDWYEIELEDGTTIEITGNNPVWLADKEAYRRVDQLTRGDLLLLT